MPQISATAADALARRPSRAPDYAAEARAFTELVEVLANSPSEEAPQGENSRVLQSLVEIALSLCGGAGSCGISILEHEDGHDTFRWRAIAGRWATLRGTTVSASSSPCAAVVQLDAALLLDHPERHFVLPPLDPPVTEALLVPFRRAGATVGTIWLVSHDETGRFDAEDLRLLTSLSRFASLAHRLIDPQKQRLENELAAMQRLHGLVDRLLACHDQQTALQEILLASMQITAAEMGNVQLLDPASNTLQIVVQQGFSQEFLDHFREVKCGEPTACGRAVEQRQRIIVEDIRQDPAFAPHLEVAKSCRWRAVQSTPLISRSGKVLGVMSTHYQRPFRPSEVQLRMLDLYARQAADWIERQRAEEALQRHIEQFEALLNHAPLGMYLVDDNFRIRHANPIALEAFGDIPGGVLGRRLDEVARICWLPDLADEIVRIFRHTFETGESYETPERAERRADRGVTEYYKVRVERIKLSDGHYGAVCYFDDISESVQARLAVGESDRRYRTLFESIAEGFCVIQMLYDDDGRAIDYRFLEVNPAFERHTGMVNARGKTARQMWPGLEQHWIDTYAQIADTGEAVHFVDHSAYMGRWFQVDAFPTGKPEDRKVALLFADITERKQAEDERHRVNEALHRANLALRETDRRKDEFLAMLAHELRNPLAPIQSAADLLKLETPPDSLAHESLAIIERQVGHLVRLIDDLLDVSRITRGKIELRKERTDLAEVVNEAIRSARGLEAHDLSVTLPSQPLTLRADPIRLNQVFTNLLNNAAKYTPAGGRIWVVVATEANEAVVRIKDTGQGIPSDKLEEVFEVFAQLNRSLERTQSGLGIGLTLVKQLVEMHGGSVRAYSDGPDRGSEFVVRLPLAVGRTSGRRSGAGTSARDVQPCRVLLADDNRDLVQGLQSLLKTSGHEVCVAFDGNQTLDIATRFRPDVILLDIAMPHRNGFEVCRAIREQPWGKEVTIVALTGWSQDTDRREAVDAGFDLYLSKPVNHAALEQLLAHVNAT